MKVVLFNGSPREKGNTTRALQLVADTLDDAKIRTETIRIGGTGLRGCIACFKCMKNKDQRCAGIEDDPLNEYLAKMIEADGMVIGSPTYFGNVTAEVKALIDRCGFVSRMNGDLFQRKVGGALAVARRAGAVDVLRAIHNFYLINDIIMPGSTYWALCYGLKPGDIQDDEEGLRAVQRMAENVGWLVKKLAKRKAA